MRRSRSDTDEGQGVAYRKPHVHSQVGSGVAAVVDAVSGASSSRGQFMRLRSPARQRGGSDGDGGGGDGGGEGGGVEMQEVGLQQQAAAELLSGSSGDQPSRGLV
jgi:hypothetical protein